MTAQMSEHSRAVFTKRILAAAPADAAETAACGQGQVAVVAATGAEPVETDRNEFAYFTPGPLDTDATQPRHPVVWSDPDTARVDSP